jgi:hypothetical protein
MTNHLWRSGYHAEAEHLIPVANLDSIAAERDEARNVADRLAEFVASVTGAVLGGTRSEVWQAAVDAAEDAMAEPHVIELRLGGWTIQHPLSCRPALFACVINRVAKSGADRLRATLEIRGPGRYVCDLGRTGTSLVVGDKL